MNRTLVSIIVGTVVGIGAGVALGYWEARPWATRTLVAPPTKPSKDTTAPSQPQAAIGETTFNFDKMESGATQKHSFPIKNNGGSPLTVEFVSHTCKCTKVEMDGNEVEPKATMIVPAGEQRDVLLEWSANVPAGPFRHGANFITNDPALTRIELHVEGEIVDSTTLAPAQLVFGSVPIGQPAKAEMLVMASLESEVQILSHEVQDAKLAERIKIAVEPVAKADLPRPDIEAAARIVATLDPGTTIGPFNGSLLFTTNLKKTPSLKVPIYGDVRGDISIIATTGWSQAEGILRMQPVMSSKGAKSSLKVSIRGEHAADTEVTVAKVDPPELKASLGEHIEIRENLVHIPLTIEIPPGTPPMVRASEDLGGEGEVILATTHPTTKEVRLRVTFTVQP